MRFFFYSYSIEAGITEPVQTAPEEPETVKVSKTRTLTINAQTQNPSLYLYIKWYFSIFLDTNSTV